jgi:glycosyltransferase involved in cell wall biosynthesis
VRILISHPNYPAQFRRQAPSLVALGHEVVFLHANAEWHAPDTGGVRLLRYEPHRSVGGAAIHPYLRRFEAAVLQGQAAYRACEQLRHQGWRPDLIINHVGFGNGLYLSDAFAGVPRIGLFEWYYNAYGSDVDFLRHGVVEPDRQLRLRGWNAQLLLELAACDRAVCPTHWQRQQFPPRWRDHLQVIHEGIDVEALAGLRSAGLPRPSCLPPDPQLEVVTYVSRGFEEYRGFPQAIAALARLQQLRPQAHVLLVGSDVVAYGSHRSDGRSWRDWALQQGGLDPARTHWLGVLQSEAYHQVLACSTVHLYLTIPFVLSWSLLEAMAAGCAIVASATAPVQEVLQHGRSALLVDFFDPEAQAQAMAALLADAPRRQALVQGAAAAAQAYGAQQGLAAWLALLESTVCVDTDQSAPARCTGSASAV